MKTQGTDSGKTPVASVRGNRAVMPQRDGRRARWGALAEASGSGGDSVNSARSLAA